MTKFHEQLNDLRRLAGLTPLTETTNVKRIKGWTAPQLVYAFAANYLAAMAIIANKDKDGLALVDDLPHASLNDFSSSMSEIDMLAYPFVAPKDPEVVELLGKDETDKLVALHDKWTTFSEKFHKLIKLIGREIHSVRTDPNVTRIDHLDMLMSLNASITATIWTKQWTGDGAKSIISLRTIMGHVFDSLEKNEPVSITHLTKIRDSLRKLDPHSKLLPVLIDMAGKSDETVDVA